MPRSRTKERPEPIFWVDECLGVQFESTLRVGGLRVEANVFQRGTPDIVWMPAVANNKWTAITKDHLKSDLDEQIALMQHGVQVFVIIGNGRHRELAELFLDKIKWVRSTLAKSNEAFIGKIYVKGGRTEVVTLEDLCSRTKRRWGR